MTGRISKLLYIALSQVGVKEEGRNNVPYNTWYYGRPVCDSAGTGAYAWCAVFLAWCGWKAGLSAAIPKENNVRDLTAHYSGCGRYFQRDEHLPDSGDIVFFRGSAGRHMGFAVATDGNRLLTVEGNTGDAVGLRQYALNDPYIVGYARPDYERVALNADNDTEKEVLSLPTLKKGAQGEAVRALQIRLLYEGYDLGRTGAQSDGADGDFGEKTRLAVVAYQKKQGLSADGIAGVQTLAKLYGLT